MSHMIAELWNGNISLCDHCGTQDEEIKKLTKLMERNRSAMFEKINPEQKSIFEKYLDCSEDYLLRMTELAFCDGFSFASKLWVEALAEER